MLHALLPIATGLALLSVWRKSEWARVYVSCEFFGWFIVEGAYRIWGYEHPFYAVLWALTMGICYFSGIIYAAHCLFFHSRLQLVKVLLAFLLPAILVIYIYLALRSSRDSLPYQVFLALFSGQITGSIGLITASCKGIERRILGGLWLAMCCYHFTFSVGYVQHHDLWMGIDGAGGINSWLPASVYILFFSTLAISRFGREKTAGWG